MPLSSSCGRSLVASAALCLLLPATAAAQQSTIVATATVRARPLSLLDVSRTALPGELRVRIAGCGAGALTVDARSLGGALLRTARLTIAASTECGTRSLTVLLPNPASSASEFLVSLEQSDAMLSPSFSQFVVPAAVVATGLRGALSY
jgi:hypothetical protein